MAARVRFGLGLGLGFASAAMVSLLAHFSMRESANLQAKGLQTSQHASPQAEGL